MMEPQVLLNVSDWLPCFVTKRVPRSSLFGQTSYLRMPLKA